MAADPVAHFETRTAAFEGKATVVATSRDIRVAPFDAASGRCAVRGVPDRLTSGRTRPTVPCPPMLPRLFTVLSAVSLVPCAATRVLWTRSHGVLDGLAAGVGGRAVQVVSSGGRSVVAAPEGRPAAGGARWRTDGRTLWDDLAGDPFLAMPGPLGTARVRTAAAAVLVPHGMASSATAVLPAAWTVRRRRRRREATRAGGFPIGPADPP